MPPPLDPVPFPGPESDPELEFLPSPADPELNRRCLGLGWNELGVGVGRVRVEKRAVTCAPCACGKIVLRRARDGRIEGLRWSWRCEAKLGDDLSIELGREIHFARRVGRTDMVGWVLVAPLVLVRVLCASGSELGLRMERSWNAGWEGFFVFLGVFGFRSDRACGSVCRS